MIQIILVNEESRASQYGIGTYIKATLFNSFTEARDSS